MMRGPVLVLDGCSVDLDRLRVFRAGVPDAALSAREGALLRALADAGGEAVGREQLAEVVGVSSPRAVDHAVRRLRDKVEEHRRAPVHVVTVHGVGYALHERRLDPEPAPAAEARWLRLTACTVDLASRTVVSPTGTSRLSPLEAALLGYLAARPNQPIDRDTLLHEVWGYRATRTNTLATTLRRLRRKVCRDPSRPVNLVTRGRTTVFVPPAAESVRRGRGFVVRRAPAGLAALHGADPEGAQEALQALAARMESALDDDDVLEVDAGGVSAWCARAAVARAVLDEGSETGAVCAGEVVWLPASRRLSGPAAVCARALAAAAPAGGRWVEASAPELGGPATVVVPVPDLGRVVPVCGEAEEPLIGRDALQAAVLRALEPGRVVSLVGVAGAGKTRLADAALERIRGPGIRLELAPLRSVAALVEAVERALGAAFDPHLDGAGRRAAAGRALAVQGAVLVVLDNAEHLRVPVAEVLREWVAAAPAAKWLVTSRTALEHPAEVVVPVPPLAGDEAVLLLAHHAGLAHRPWTPDEARGLAELAGRLDGLPLALVLAGRAAARLGLAAALERVETGLELEEGEGRHRSLGAALQATWAVLSPMARDAAGALSPFAGAVPAALLDDIASPAAVGELSDHGWVERIDAGVRMRVPIAAFAAERAAAQVVEAHAEVVVRHAEGLAAGVHRHGGARALASLSALSAELDTVVSRAEEGPVAAGLGARALLARYPLSQWTGGADVAARYDAWAGRVGDAGLAADLWHRAGEISGRAGRGEDALSSLERALERAPDAATAARVVASRGLAHANLGSLDAAEADYLAAIEACEATDQPEIAGRARGNLGLLRWWQGRLDDARACYTAALRRLREHGSMAFEAVVLGNLTILDVEARRLPEAAAGYQEVLALHREMGNVMFEGVVTGNLAEVWDLLGERDEARACFERALHLHRLCADAMSEGIVLVNLGQMVVEEGDLDRGGALIEAGATTLSDAPPLYAAISGAAAAVIHHARGELQRARQGLDRAVARLDEVGAPLVLRFCWARHAAVLADLGALDAAAASLARAEATDGDEPPGVLEAARAHLARARGEDPEPHLAALRRIAEQPAARDARLALRVLARR